MADASENMRFLMKEFDTAPAGTREEAMMAQELAEKIHLHGLETINQDFTYPAHGKTVLGAAMVLIAIAGILAGIGVQALSIVMLILGILAAAVYGLDFCGIHCFPPSARPAAAKNLIARHPSATAAGSKLRPVVVIAHYDTPRADIMAMPLLRGFLPYLENAALIAMGLELLSMLIQVLPCRPSSSRPPGQSPSWRACCFCSAACASSSLGMSCPLRVAPTTTCPAWPRCSA